VILFLAGGLSAHVNGQTVYAEGGMAARSAIYDLSSAEPVDQDGVSTAPPHTEMHCPVT
jgi:hypothetical protein